MHESGPSGAATMVQAENDVEEFKLELRKVVTAIAVVLTRCPLCIGAGAVTSNNWNRS
jgi:hypothetical protein